MCRSWCISAASAAPADCSPNPSALPQPRNRRSSRRKCSSSPRPIGRIRSSLDPKLRRLGRAENAGREGRTRNADGVWAFCGSKEVCVVCVKRVGSEIVFAGGINECIPTILSMRGVRVTHQPQGATKEFIWLRTFVKHLRFTVLQLDLPCWGK